MRSSGFLGTVIGLFLSVVCWAQTPAGAIEGTITDPSLAAVPHAAVAVTESATGRLLSVLTNNLGRYSIGFAARPVHGAGIGSAIHDDGNFRISVSARSGYGRRPVTLGSLEQVVW